MSTIGKLSEMSNIPESFKNLLIKNEEIEKLAKVRGDICNDCPFNSKNKSNSFTKSIDYCTDCGCIIAAKIRGEDNKCPKGKW